MTTTEKLTLLLNFVNEDFSNVEVYYQHNIQYGLDLEDYNIGILFNSDYELKVKEQL